MTEFRRQDGYTSGVLALLNHTIADIVIVLQVCNLREKQAQNKVQALNDVWQFVYGLGTSKGL